MLRRLVCFAKAVESSPGAASFTKPLNRVAYGSLVRTRRYAEAILKIGRGSAYEARPTIRSMIEISGNYQWMRLRQPHQRASRFLKYLTLDHLKLIESIPAAERSPAMKATRCALRSQRSRLRHLFRETIVTGGKPKLRWARSWARVSSFEARLDEVERDQLARLGRRSNIYFHYRWFSSAVHGGPYSVAESITPTPPHGYRPKPSPETHPSAPLVVAAACLAEICEMVCEDMNLPVKPQAQALHQEVRTLGRI